MIMMMMMMMTMVNDDDGDDDDDDDDYDDRDDDADADVGALLGGVTALPELSFAQNHCPALTLTFRFGREHGIQICSVNICVHVVCHILMLFLVWIV